MRTFLIAALLASTQAIKLGDTPPPADDPPMKCEDSSDGISVCLKPSTNEWIIDMKHIDHEKKSYKTIKLPGPSGKNHPKDSPAPWLHDDSSPFGDVAVEEKKKEEKKAALIQAAARAQKKSAAEIASLKNATANATMNATANASKNATGNATKNVSTNANVSGNATTWPQNWTGAAHAQ